MLNISLPTRTFSILVDPKGLSLLQETPFVSVISWIAELEKCDLPIEIRMEIPASLEPSNSEKFYPPYCPPFYEMEEPTGVLEMRLDENIKGKKRKALLNNEDEAIHCRKLLSLAETQKVDGLLTNSQLLLDLRYPIYQHHLIKIIPFNEFEDFVEVCAHGHSIFSSTSNPYGLLTFDVFYQMEHWKGSRLAKWFFSIQQNLTLPSLTDHLRSAFLQRYPFILYARDISNEGQVLHCHISPSKTFNSFFSFRSNQD